MERRFLKTNGKVIHDCLIAHPVSQVSPEGKRYQEIASNWGPLGVQLLRVAAHYKQKTRNFTKGRYVQAKLLLELWVARVRFILARWHSHKIELMEATKRCIITEFSKWIEPIKSVCERLCTTEGEQKFLHSVDNLSNFDLLYLRPKIMFQLSDGRPDTSASAPASDWDWEEEKTRRKNAAPKKMNQKKPAAKKQTAKAKAQSKSKSQVGASSDSALAVGAQGAVGLTVDADDDEDDSSAALDAFFYAGHDEKSDD
ncbi:unnamed protein product [Amoebophrya sp. A25]|nr:unnamed protein product [Amoebophrya sp. A25]|eukprot:GSA25T00023954001.1